MFYSPWSFDMRINNAAMQCMKFLLWWSIREWMKSQCRFSGGVERFHPFINFPSMIQKMEKTFKIWGKKVSHKKHITLAETISLYLLQSVKELGNKELDECDNVSQTHLSFSFHLPFLVFSKEGKGTSGSMNYLYLWQCWEKSQKN